MRVRKFTAADICAVSRYDRYQLRAVLAELPEYATQKTAARVAREFKKIDLILLSVVAALDMEFNIRRPAIALLIEELRKTLSTLKVMNENAALLITFEPPKVLELIGDEPIKNGLVIALPPILKRINTYLAGVLNFTQI